MTGLRLVVGGEARRRERPAARLRVRVAPRVREIDLGDPRQVRLSQPVTALVLVAELAEDVRPREPHVAAFVPGPHCRAADQLRGLLARDVAHLLDADHGREPVAAGLEVRRRREQRQAAGRAGAFVTRRRARRRGRDALRRRAPPRWPWPQNSSAAKLPTWPVSMSRASRRAAAGHRRALPACRRRSRGPRAPSWARSPSASRRACTRPLIAALLRSAPRPWPRARSARITLPTGLRGNCATMRRRSGHLNTASPRALEMPPADPRAMARLARLRHDHRADALAQHFVRNADDGPLDEVRAGRRARRRSPRARSSCRRAR